jgi:hypothetical protein
MPFTYSLCMLPGTLACLLYHTALDTNRILYFTDTIQHGTLSLTLSVSTVVRTISCRDRSCSNAHAIARASRTTVSVTVHADTYRLTPTPVASLLEAAAHAGRENRGEGARL